MDKKLNLKEDQKHTRETTQRWLSKIQKNRETASPDYKEEWRSEQCFACQYYITLNGRLSKDWGACSNPASPFDGRVMFEHDGCEQYSFAIDEEEF